MAIPWITALKMVPWGDVIEAAPSVIKTAKGLLKKAPAQNDAAPAPSPASSAVTSTPADAGELALQHIIQLQKRIDQLEHAQQASAAVIEQMAEQQARIVETVPGPAPFLQAVRWGWAFTAFCARSSRASGRCNLQFGKINGVFSSFRRLIPP